MSASLSPLTGLMWTLEVLTTGYRPRFPSLDLQVYTAYRQTYRYTKLQQYSARYFCQANDTRHVVAQSSGLKKDKMTKSLHLEKVAQRENA